MGAARVCATERSFTNDFFANDEVPRAILSFVSVYQRLTEAEAKEVRRGVIIFSLKERHRCHEKKGLLHRLLPSPKGTIKRASC